MKDDIRGFLERSLDKEVSKESIESSIKFLKSVIKDLNSKYSPLIAYEFGFLAGVYWDHFKMSERRDPRVDNMMEFVEWFETTAVRKIEEKADVYGI